MKKNLGILDRIVRFIIAIVIGYLFFTNQINGGLGIVLMVIAGVFLITSLVSTCPIYMLLGWSSRKEKLADVK
jgi:hypothetical protein